MGDSARAAGTVLTGTFLRAEDNHLTLKTDKEQLIRLPISHISDLAVSAGRERKTGAGLKKGAPDDHPLLSVRFSFRLRR